MEAVAERKKNARMVLAEAEKDISEMLKDASEVYAGDQDAMKLRTMHLAYESVEQSGGTLVIPSAFSAGFERRLLSAQRSSLVEGLQASGLFGSGQHASQRCETRRFWLLYELGCGRMPQSALIL